MKPKSDIKPTEPSGTKRKRKVSFRKLTTTYLIYDNGRDIEMTTLTDEKQLTSQEYLKELAIIKN